MVIMRAFQMFLVVFLLTFGLYCTLFCTADAAAAAAAAAPVGIFLCLRFIFALSILPY